MNHRLSHPARVVVAAALALSCNGNNSSFTPGISAVIPTVVTGAVSRLRINGARFEPGVTIFWNQHALPTQFESSEKLSVQLDPAVLAVGQTGITVQNPGGLVSEPFPISVQLPLLTIANLSPAGAPVGGADFVLTVNGFSFTPTSRVLWNDLRLATQFVSERVLTAQVPASLIAGAGSGIVEVEDGGALIQRSDPAIFDIGPSAVRVTSEAAVDLAWDSTHGVIAVASENPRSVAVVDPASAAIVSRAAAWVQNVSVSASGRYVYAGMAFDPAFARLDLPGLTNGMLTLLPPSVQNNSTGLKVAASPNDDLTSAALMPDGLFIYSSGWLQHFISPTAANLLFSVVWGADGSVLYVVRGGDLLRYGVDAMGIVNPDVPTTPLAFVRGGIHFEPSNGLIYADDRSVTGSTGQSFPFPTVSDRQCVVTTDGTGVNKVFFACQDNRGDPSVPRLIFVQSYDPTTHASLGVLSLGAGDPPRRIIRWGSDGIAVATGTSIILYQGAFVR